MAEAEEKTEAAAEDATGAAEGATGETGAKKAKRAGEKGKRTHGDRAMTNLRGAKRGQREVSDPAERAKFLLAEANVLALLDVADALRGGDGSDG